MMHSQHERSLFTQRMHHVRQENNCLICPWAVLFAALQIKYLYVINCHLTCSYYSGDKKDSFKCFFNYSDSAVTAQFSLLLLKDWMAFLMWMFLANMCRVPVTTYILVLIADCLHFHTGKIEGFVDKVITGLEQFLSLEMREQTLTFKRADDATVPVLGCDFVNQSHFY